MPAGRPLAASVAVALCLLLACRPGGCGGAGFQRGGGSPEEYAHENRFRVPWGNLYEHLLNIAHEGLQANRIQDDIWDNFEWQYEDVDGTDLLKQRLDTLHEIVHTNLDSVLQLRQAIVDNIEAFQQEDQPLVERERNCCLSGEKHPDGCVTTPRKMETGQAALTPPQVVEVMKNNAQRYPLALLQFFALLDGSLLMYPSKHVDYQTCVHYDPRRRYWYVESEAPYPRDVVLLVDQTSTVRHPELLLPTLNRVIDCVTSSDRLVAVPSNDIANNGRIRGNWWVKGMRAGLGVWMDGQESLKDKLRQLIKTEVATVTNRFDNPSDAMRWAQYMLYEKPLYELSQRREAVNIVVLVTGRPGWSSWRGDTELADTVFNIMQENSSLIVFTLPGADDGYSEGSPRVTSEPGLHIVPITSEEDLYKANLARYFLNTNDDLVSDNAFQHQHEGTNAVLTLPYFDAFGAGLIMSICLPIEVNSTFMGSVCNDVSIVNSFERILRVPDIEDAYVFAMDGYGRAMMHPLLPSPTKLSDHPLFTQMTALEQDDEVFPILKDMVEGRSGSKVVVGHLIHSVGRPFQIALPNAVNSRKKSLKFLWGSVKGWPLSLAVVLPQNNFKCRSVTYRCRQETMCQAPHFQYHRWDLDPHKPETCRFFGMEAAKGNALVKLSPSCFTDSLNYIRNEDNVTVSKLYGIFQQGHSMSGFLEGNTLLEDVTLGERAEEYWREKQTISQFIGARYMGTIEGVFVVYPGTQLRDQDYDPRSRPWYTVAMDNLAHDHVVTMSPPYCDSFGAGLIVTVSMALTSPKPDQQVIAVVAGDFTSQYMNDNFVRQLPQCEDKFTCFLVDKSGYVVVHTKWQNEPPLHPTECEVPVHGAHINMVEPVIGLKLVEMNILKRRGCYDHAQSDLFQYWRVELPPYQTQVVTEQFAMNHVPFTNLFLIVYEPFTTSALRCTCPKNWVPGKPLRCRNTCVDYCECPCIAGPNTVRCSKHDKDLLRDKLPACWPTTKIEEDHPRIYDSHLKDLPPCNTYNCTAEDKRSCSKMSMACFWYQDACIDLNTLYFSDNDPL